MKHVLALLLLMASHLPAKANSLLVSIDHTSWMVDVQTKLANAGVTADVFNINNTYAAPTQAQLQGYQSVLVWTYYGCFFSVCSTLGDNLDAYVRAGGIVVVAATASDIDTGYGLGGLFRTNDDWAIEAGPYASATHLTLGTIQQPGSPLLNGVATLDGGSLPSYTGTVLNAAAVDVIDWSNGVPLLAYRQVGKGWVISLNMYPDSSDKFSLGWKSNTDGARLMANALEFTGPVAVPEPAPATLVVAGIAALAVARCFGRRG